MKISVAADERTGVADAMVDHDVELLSAASEAATIPEA